MTVTDRIPRAPRRSVSRDALLLGLHRYRALARQDLNAAPATDDPPRWRRHAATRQGVYDELTALAERSVDEAIEAALARYREVPYAADGVEIDVALLAEARAGELLPAGRPLRRAARPRRPGAPHRARRPVHHGMMAVGTGAPAL